MGKTGPENGLRIGIDGRELLSDQLTGIGRYLRNFLEIAVLTYPEHQFIIYGNQHTAFDLEAPNLELRIVTERFTFWWDQVVLGRLIRNGRLDVFLSPYNKGPYFASCPVVLTVHDLIYLEISDRGPIGKYVYNTTYKAVRGPNIRSASRIITDSQYSKRDIVQKLGVPPDKVYSIPIAISPAYRPIRDASQIEDFTTKHGISHPYILYVGNFKPHKNVGCLVEAFADLPEDLKAAYQLALCGRRDRFRDEIQRTAEGLGLGDRVIFLDFVADSEMPLLYSAADVFAFPSLYEGYGLPPLEAMACGTPVVSSGSTSLQEVVGSGGMIVDARHPEEMRQALESVLTQDEHRRALVEAGLRHVKAFTMESAAEQVLNTLKEAADSCKSPHV